MFEFGSEMFVIWELKAVHSIVQLYGIAYYQLFLKIGQTQSLQGWRDVLKFLVFVSMGAANFCTKFYLCMSSMYDYIITNASYIK